MYNRAVYNHEGLYLDVAMDKPDRVHVDDYREEWLGDTFRYAILESSHNPNDLSDASAQRRIL